MKRPETPDLLDDRDLPHRPIRNSPSSQGSDASEGPRRFLTAVDQIEPDQVGHQLSLSRPRLNNGPHVGPGEGLDLSFVLVQNRTVEARELRSALRGARYRADGPAVVSLADEVLQRADVLQLLGDGLLAAVDQRAEGAREAGTACAATLRQRGWDGDDLLADHIEASSARDDNAELTPMAVDLEELANILEGDPAYGGGRIDRRTGEVWPQPAIDYAVEMGDEDESESQSSDRWLRVECLGSVESYRDMKFFIGTVEDAQRGKPPRRCHRWPRRLPKVQRRPSGVAQRHRSMDCLFR